MHQQQGNPVCVDNTGAPLNQMAPLPVNNTLPVAEGTQQFCLRWNSYPATVATQLAALRQAEDFVDVTLACDGRQLRAHKLVLSACSPYFMQLFKSTPCQHPVIFLRDVGFRQLVALLEFMYAGEVNVSQSELPALLRTAEALQVRGLADTTANNNIASQPPPQRQGFSPQYAPAPPPAQTMMPPPQAQAPIPIPGELPGDQILPDPPTTSPLDSAPKSTKEEVDMAEDANRNPDEEESSSESNDSQDDFEVTESDMKDFINHAPVPDQPQDPDLFGGTQDETGNAVDLNQDLGNVSIAGSQSEEETSDEDDDDGECKEFTYQSDASYSQETMPEAGGNENGESIAGPSGTSGPTTGTAVPGDLKEEGSVLTTGSGSSGGRSRLSRSLWPPGIPYHGPQQCPYCSRVLSNVGNWRKHVLTMHFAREKVYKCRHCNSSFRTAEYLQKHYVRVHNYPQKMTRRKYVEQT